MRKSLWVLMATAFVDMLGFALIFPLLPFYALNLGAQPWVIGPLIASFSIAQLASSPLWGRASDRWGRKPVLLIGLGAAAIAYVVFAAADAVWLLFLSRAVQGAGGGTTGVIQAYVSDATEPQDRARALGWLSAATSAGVMIGPAIGSLATHLGTEAPGLVAALLCTINIAFAHKFLPESRRGTAGPQRSVRTAVWHVVRHPGLPASRLVWIYAVGMGSFTSMTAVLALYFKHEFGITEQTIGYFFVYIGALSVVMRALVLGWAVDRLGEVRVMRLGAILLGLGLLLYPVPRTILMLAIVIPIIPIGTALLFPSTTALLSHESAESEMGQTMGVQHAFGGVARVVGPLWATPVYQGLGPATPFYVAAGVMGLVLTMAFRVQEKRRAPARAVQAGAAQSG